jgi:uracil-DNA glycosylase family 4
MLSTLSDCPIPGATGRLQPEGLCLNGVLMLGEAMGRFEVEDSLPFRPQAPAGSVLERAIRRCGFRREQFALWNVVPAHPPNDHLEGASYEAEAIAWGLAQLPEIIERFKPRVILALGGVAFKAVTGLRGILESRGYPVPSNTGIPVIGALHPSFLRRGAMGYLSSLMHDIRFAVTLAAAVYTPLGNKSGDLIPVEFWSPVLWRQVRYEIPWPLAPTNQPVVPPDYALYPTEDVARDFLRDAMKDASRLVAYDIETPRSVKAGEEDSDEPDESPIISVQFSIAPGTGIFLPYRAPFIDVIKATLALPNPKLGCNNWRFDDPRLASEGMTVAGTRHDLRWAWKHLQPDLSAALQAITSYYAPDFQPWKHLDAAFPSFYGVRDVDACLRCV